MWVCDQDGKRRDIACETYWLQGGSVLLTWMDDPPIVLFHGTEREAEQIIAALDNAIREGQDFFDVNQPECVP